MKYQDAQDLFDELKNFEGKATFKGEETVIDLFVLLPKDNLQNIEIKSFLETHDASTGFELESDHGDEYTIIGISREELRYSNDMDYFMKLLVW